MKKSSINGPSIPWQTVSHNQMVRFWKHGKRIWRFLQDVVPQVPQVQGDIWRHQRIPRTKFPALQTFCRVTCTVTQLNAGKEHIRENMFISGLVEGNMYIQGTMCFFGEDTADFPSIELGRFWNSRQSLMGIRQYLLLSRKHGRNLELVSTDGTMTMGPSWLQFAVTNVHHAAESCHRWATWWQYVTNMPPIIPSDGLMVGI